MNKIIKSDIKENKDEINFNQVLRRANIEAGDIGEEEALKHYGVLGMKWGVRKGSSSSGGSKSSKRRLRKEKKQVKKEIRKVSGDVFEKSIYECNSVIAARHQANLKKHGKHYMSKPSKTKVARAQYDFASKTLQKSLQKNLKAAMKGKFDTKKFDVDVTYDLTKDIVPNFYVGVKSEMGHSSLSHAEEDEDFTADEILEFFDGLEIDITFNDDGTVKFLIPELSLSHDSLTHWGVRGMKWGVRKSSTSGSSSNSGPKPKSQKQIAREKNKAEKARRKDILKNRRIVSDEELKKTVQRMELERRLKDLSTQDVAPGKKAATKQLSKMGSQILAKTIDKATTAIVAAGLKKAGIPVPKDTSDNKSKDDE